MDNCKRNLFYYFLFHFFIIVTSNNNVFENVGKNNEYLANFLNFSNNSLLCQYFINYRLNNENFDINIDLTRIEWLSNW